MVRYTVALSKGELGRDIQDFMRELGSPVEVVGKPTLTQTYGDVTYRVIRPSDVARLVGDRYDFGITGMDRFVESGSCSNVLREFPFGTGKVVLYGKLGVDYKSLRSPRFVTADYPNITRRIMTELGYPDSELSVVSGADEGYVDSGECDLGVGCTFSGDTLERNNLVVLREIMDTCGVLIARSGLTIDDFYKSVRGGMR